MNDKKEQIINYIYSLDDSHIIDFIYRLMQSFVRKSGG